MPFSIPHRFIMLITCAAAPAVLAGCQAHSGALRLQAEQAIARGEYDTADRKLAIVLDRNPADWKALYWTGLIRLKQNRFLDARLLLERAYAVRDEHLETPDILDALAEAYLREPNQEKLVILLRSATQRYGAPRDYVRQGKYLARAGDVDGAEIAFVKATRFAAEDDIWTWLQAADFYEGIGDKDNALVALNHALRIEPHNLVIQRRIRTLQQPGAGAGTTVGVKPEGS